MLGEWELIVGNSCCFGTYISMFFFPSLATQLRTWKTRFCVHLFVGHVEMLLYLHRCVIPETHPFRLSMPKTFVYLYWWVVLLSVFCHLASQDYLDQNFLLPFYSFYICLNCVFSFAPCFLISSVFLLIVNDKHRRTFSFTAFSSSSVLCKSLVWTRWGETPYMYPAKFPIGLG